MMDEFFDRTYQAGRADLNDGIDALLRRTSRSVLNTFEVLNRIEFAAPWRKRRSDTGCA